VPLLLKFFFLPLLDAIFQLLFSLILVFQLAVLQVSNAAWAALLTGAFFPFLSACGAAVAVVASSDAKSFFYFSFNFFS